MPLQLRHHAVGVFLEAVPGGQQLGFAGHDEPMSVGEIGGVLLKVVDILQQIVASGKLPGCKQVLRRRLS
jgi:hypothetical protein